MFQSSDFPRKQKLKIYRMNRKLEERTDGCLRMALIYQSIFYQPGSRTPMVVLTGGGSSTERAKCSTTLNLQSAKYNHSPRLTLPFFSLRQSKTLQLFFLSVVLMFSWCFSISAAHFPASGSFSVTPISLPPDPLPPQRSTCIVNLPPSPTSPASLAIVATPLLIASNSPIKALARLHIVAE